jgi:hypothetical protein
MLLHLKASFDGERRPLQAMCFCLQIYKRQTFYGARVFSAAKRGGGFEVTSSLHRNKLARLTSQDIAF